MARITKKEIYAKYGIEFKKEGSAEKIFCSPLNIWINPLMPVGTNSKVGKAATWSMLHGNETFNIMEMHEKVRAVMELANIETISGSCPIHCTGCYCDNGCFNWPQNKALNMMKLILARLHMAWLECTLTAQIEADKLTQVRIHVAGDFFSAEYVQMWVRIANKFEKVVFWTYTKVDFALKAFQVVKNVFIVPSMTPLGFNFGTCSELIYRYNKLTAMGYRVHICACVARNLKSIVQTVNTAVKLSATNAILFFLLSTPLTTIKPERLTRMSLLSFAISSEIRATKKGAHEMRYYRDNNGNIAKYMRTSNRFIVMTSCRTYFFNTEVEAVRFLSSHCYY